MKVYFSVSISGLDEKLTKTCNLICDYFEELGHTPVYERRFNNKEQYLKNSEKQNYQEQQKISRQKKEADVVVVEVSRPSIGIGQEISMALLHNKYVIALHDQAASPHVLTDIQTDRLLVVEYSDDTLRDVINESMDFISQNKDQRFNLILSNDLVKYLDTLSEKMKISKADIIRDLIKDKMRIEDRYK